MPSLVRRHWNNWKERYPQHAAYSRMFFIFLGLVVIVASTRLSIPDTSLATSPYTQTFLATSDFNYTSNTTGGVTTANIHSRAHLPATDAWTPAMGLKNGERVNDLVFASTDANYGWVVTQDANIYRTTDAGTLWHIQTSGTTTPLRAAFFQNTSTGWVVGGSNDDATGVILKTTNGGTTWTNVTPSGAPGLYDIHFSSSSNGWVVGASGAIYRTTNGTSTVAADWTSQNVDGITQKLSGVYVDGSGTKGMIVGFAGKILITSDSGTTWTVRAPANALETSALPSVNFHGLHFRNQSLGWIFGVNGIIFKTTDNGATALTIQSVGPTGNPGFESYINTFFPGAWRSTISTLENGWFGDDNTGIVAGDEGTILKTTNSGTAWTQQLSGTNHNLYSVSMTSATTAYVGGETSVILKTTDGGSGSATSWSSRTQGALTTFDDVVFISSSDGVLVGQEGTMLVTTNGGTNWFGVPNPISGSGDLTGVAEINNTTYWVVANQGGIYRTSNTGIAWSTQASGVSTALNDIAAVDTNTAFVVGNAGKILNTTNAGSTWNAQTSGTTNALNNVYASTDGQFLIAVGNSGTIERTTNGGAGWSLLATSDVTMLNGDDSVANYTLYGVDMATGSIGWIVGNNGLILKTTNAGVSWTQQTSGFTEAIYSVGIVNSSTVWLGAYQSTVLTTTNGGTTWTTQLLGAAPDINAIAITSATNFWLVGDTTLIANTTNGGGSFNFIHTDKTKFIVDTEGSGSTIYGAGHGGTIIKSTDTGVSWSTLTSGTTNDLIGIAVTDTVTAWAVGQGGTILKTIDGTTWAAQTSGTGNNLQDIDPASSSVLWAVGQGGTILKTINGGTTWSAQTSGTTNVLYVIDAIDTTTAIAVGINGTILKTIDGGTTWSAQTSGTTNALLGASFADSSVGWTVGSAGTILKTINGGTTWSAQTTSLGSVNVYRVYAVDSLTAFAAVLEQSLLHTIDGGTTWTSVTDERGFTSLWAKDFGTVVAVGGGYDTVRYTPSYTSSSRVVSTTFHNDTQNLVNKATLTATQTTNGQTITYYLINADTASSICGDGSWKQVESGVQYTFQSNGPKLYWCATLSSNSPTTTPVISQVQITYTTTEPGRSGGDTGGGGGGGGNTGCTTNDDCRIGYYCETATKLCLLSDTEQSSNPPAPRKQAPLSSTDRIEWKFLDTANNETGFRLCKQTCDTTKGGVLIDEKVSTNLSSIIEGVITPLSPNTLYDNRVVQSFNNAGYSPETALDSTRTLAETPPTPTVITTGSSSTLSVTRGKNPVTTEFLIHRITGTDSQEYLGADGSVTNTPSWNAFNAWGTEVRNGNGVVDTERQILLTRLSANSQYLFEIKARTSETLLADRRETIYSPTVVVNTAIEQPTGLTSNPIPTTATSLTVWATNASSSATVGTFMNLGRDQSAVWFENTTAGTNSGWTTDNHWTSTKLAPDTDYRFRVKARNLVGQETAWSQATTLRTRNAVPETPNILKPSKGEEISKTTVRIEGTAQSNLNVQIQIDTQDKRTATPNDTGEWAIETTLLQGAHTLIVYSVDPATSLRSDEATRSFSVKLPPPPCTKDVWTCSAWNECSAQASQTRLCRRTTDCPATQTPKPEEIRSCTPPPINPIVLPPADRRPIEPGDLPIDITATPDIAVPPTPPTPPAPPTLPPTIRLDDRLPEPFADTRVRDIYINNEPVDVNVITTITASGNGAVTIQGRLQPSENVSVRLGSRTTNTVTDERGQFATTLDLSGYEGRRAFIEIPTQSDFDRLKIDNVTVNKSPVIAGSITSVTISGQKKSRRLLVRGRGEPGSIVTVIIESTPREIPVPVQSDGSWDTDVDVSTLEQGRHHIKLKTVSATGESPIVQIAQFDVAAEPVAEAPESPKGAFAAVSNAVGNGAQAVANELKNGFPAVRQGVTVVAQKTAEAVAVTHEAIVAVEPQTKAALAVALPTVVIANPPLVAAVPQVPFFVYHFFNWLMIILGIRKRRVPWGVVYDAITKQAIPLSIVRLTDSTTRKLIETQVSDRAGRFGFLVAPGNYSLAAVKAGYTSPSKIVTELADGEYQPCYHQEVIPIQTGNQTVSMAIPLDPVNAAAQTHSNAFKHTMNRAWSWMRKANLPIMMIGLTFAVVVAANVPTLTNILMAVGYGFMTAFQRLLSPSEPKPWGTVFNTATLSAVPLALVDIIDTKYNKVLKTRLSDYEGRFTFLPPKGMYKLQARKTGFTFNPLETKHSNKFRHPYKGDTITVASDREAISVDIPLTPAPMNIPEPPKSALTPAPPQVEPRSPLPTPSPTNPVLTAAPANDPLLPILSPQLLSNSPSTTSMPQPPRPPQG